MASVALTGRPKPTPKWTFNKLDSEPVVTDFSMDPLKTPNPLKPTFDVHRVAGETSCPLGFPRSIRLEFPCQQITRHRRRVQKIVKWVSRCTMARRNCDGIASQTRTAKVHQLAIVLRASRITCHDNVQKLRTTASDSPPHPLRLQATMHILPACRQHPNPMG